MTNELIEAIPSPLWLITKPGGYKHINQFGRVYRTRELALRHCDVNEMVVELRLAPAPEPGAIQELQHLRGWCSRARQVLPLIDREQGTELAVFVSALLKGDVPPSTGASEWSPPCPILKSEPQA